MSTSTTSTVADELVRSLLRHGVDTIFGIGGTHTLQLLGAIERSTIRFVPARTELGAAYMAVGYARSIGRPAVVLTSTGPGALNVAGVLEDARWSSTPVVHLTTSVGGVTFAGGVHETPHQRDLLRLVSKNVVEVDLHAVNESVGSAIRIACRHPRGPVTIDVLAGHWFDPTNVSELCVDVDDDNDDEPNLEQLVTALQASQRPILFVGGGAIRDDGGRSALELAEALGAPIVTSYQGKTIASWDHPLYLGPWSSEPAVRSLVASSDLCIVVGSKLSAMATAGWQLQLPEVSLRVGPEPRPHAAYPHLREVVGNAVDVAAALLPSIERRVPWAEVSAIRDEILTRSRQTHPNEMEFVAALAAGSTGARLFAADVSKADFWAMKFMASAPGASHAFSSYLAMGSGLPMAIGMAVATGDPVIALIGDGALQMSMAELATLGDIRPPVTVLVIVDHAYGILRDNCAAVGGSQKVGVDLWNPDLQALGRAYGFEVSEVADPGELSELLAVESDAPRLVLVNQHFSRDW
jgi:acetolactate synthase-1/2/3 large subunit